MAPSQSPTAGQETHGVSTTFGAPNDPHHELQIKAARLARMSVHEAEMQLAQMSPEFVAELLSTFFPGYQLYRYTEFDRRRVSLGAFANGWANGHGFYGPLISHMVHSQANEPVFTTGTHASDSVPIVEHAFDHESLESASIPVDLQHLSLSSICVSEVGIGTTPMADGSAETSGARRRRLPDTPEIVERRLRNKEHKQKSRQNQKGREAALQTRIRDLEAALEKARTKERADTDQIISLLQRNAVLQEELRAQRSALGGDI